MHALRRDLRAGRHLHVMQGTGGLGKSAFCTEALKIYRRFGWQPLALWCADVEGAADRVAGLLRQVEAAGDALVGPAWGDLLAAVDRAAAQQPALRQPATRLLCLVQALLAGQTPPLVIYLDNLESLQAGPAAGDVEDVAAWRDPACATLWRGLRQLLQRHPGRLAVLASTRYRNRDFGAVMSFRRLPDDALWRMLAWFPSLRQLSEQSRERLVDRLAGHPRAVEFLDALIQDAILRWEYDNGPFEPGGLSVEDEQAQIIDPALPALDAKLSEDLLFSALWDRVLDGPARDLLVRAGVLRRPGDRALLGALAGEGAGTAIDTLRTTALLTEIRERKAGGPGWVFTYEVHPTVTRLAEQRSDHREVLRQDGHRRAGDHLEQAARTSPFWQVWQDNIEGAYHLRRVGEADRAFDLLAPLVAWLQGRGRMLDVLAVLAEMGDPASLHPFRGAWIHRFRGDAAQTYGDLSQALIAYRASLALAERLAQQDPGNAL